MDAIVALNAAFVRLGFSIAAATTLAEEEKEAVTIDLLQYFDDKGVKTLCATLRKPGGTIDGVAPVGGGEVPQIPNPGVYVSTRAEMNLLSACYMARHYQRTTRTLIASDLTQNKMHRYAQYKEAEDAYKEPDVLLKLSKPDKIIEFIDEWPEHLALYDGQNARPLSYVIRENTAIPPEETDPSFGEPDSMYSSLRDEIVARADHLAPQYMVDNARVFELLNEAVMEHKNVKTWIKPYAAARDGRCAWIAFKAHYRGSSELEAIETAAENKLETVVYRGEKPRYNFETHVSMQRKCHLDLEKATGQDIPGPTKVRQLLKSLQVSTMAVPVATIRAQDNLRTDFDASVNYLRSFIISSELGELRNIAAFETRKRSGTMRKNGRNNGGRGKNKNDNALDRYYKPIEWWNLDEDTKEKIMKMRAQRKISAITTKRKVHFEDEKDETSKHVLTTQRKISNKKK
jgi:hypothetical protein